MKYIEAGKIKAKVDEIIDGLKRNCSPDPLGTTEECLTSAEIEALELVKDSIDKMKQEDPTPPGIEEESKKKGWLDYGLMMSEIGLHRYNAIHRIKEHKEQFNPLAIPNLYYVAEYYESIGVEKVCCCLQAYSKDFIFTQDELKEIIEKEGMK